MIKARKLKPIKAGYDDNRIAFFPRTISRAELDAVDHELSEANAETVGKYQKSFEIKRQAIGDWSEGMPGEIVTVKGENQIKPLGEGDIPSAVNKAFADRTTENEHVINSVYQAFVAMQVPDIDFL